MNSLREFLGYFPRLFTLPRSRDHETVIDAIEATVRDGGLRAVAMPRGSGKTTIVDVAVLWAALGGRHKSVMVVAATKPAALDRVAASKSELENNELLAEDFPEVCLPIRALEGIAQRSKGQTYRGERTHIVWHKNRIVLPTIPGSPASGVVIQAAGLVGAIRGANYKRPDGSSARPTLAVIDDPQTRASAKSLTQSHDRERILQADILYLPGPGQKIAAVMPCTVVVPGDLADRMLNRTTKSEWQGIRTRMLIEFPGGGAQPQTDSPAMKLWEKYSNIRREEMIADGDGSQATEFYRANQAAMDAGAIVSWPERFNPDEISAIQHAMNLYFADAAAFWSEYQNEPKANDQGEADEDVLTPAQIVLKIHAEPRNESPIECHSWTGFIDVHKSLLYWVVTGWADKFSGYVLDYGTWPPQDVDYFSLTGATNTIQTAYKRAHGKADAFESQLRFALTSLSTQLVHDFTLNHLACDANWGKATKDVYRFCRDSKLGIIPSHGRGIGASDCPMFGWKKKTGERRGTNWILYPPSHRGLKYLMYDSHWWKSFVQTRLATPIAEPGSLSLFAAPPAKHRLIADHLTSEYGTPTEGRGRKVTEWKLTPGRDNHWLDCLVGTAVLASLAGVSIDGVRRTTQTKPKPARQRVGYL